MQVYKACCAYVNYDSHNESDDLVGFVGISLWLQSIYSKAEGGISGGSATNCPLCVVILGDAHREI